MPFNQSTTPFKHSLGRLALLGLSLGLSFSLSACAPEQEHTGEGQHSAAPASQAPASAPAARGARVSFLEGEATLSGPAGKQALKQDQIVEPGQTLRTGSKTRVELVFADGSRLRVSPGAEVKFATQTQADDAFFKVNEGEVWGNVRPAKRKLVLQGTYSTATVLGTVYNLKVTKKDTCTRVMEGNVGVHRPMSGDEAELIKQAPEREAVKADSGLKPLVDGDMVMPEKEWMKLSKHQCIVVGAGGKAHVMKIDPEQLAKEEAWVKWNRERDAALPPH